MAARYSVERNFYLVQNSYIDQLIITELYNRRALNNELVYLLVEHLGYSERSVYNRLNLLSKRGLVFKRKYPDTQSNKYKVYYYLTGSGVRVYCMMHNIPSNEYENGRLLVRHHKEWHELEIKPAAVPHHLETEKFCILLRYEIGDEVQYNELNAYANPYTIFTNGGPKTVIVPDKILTDGRRWVNVETDRSTTKQQVIKTKFDRYATYLNSIDAEQVHSILFNITPTARPTARIKLILNAVTKSREFQSLVLEGRLHVWACANYSASFSLVKSFFNDSDFFSTMREEIKNLINQAAAAKSLPKRVGLPDKENSHGIAPDYIAHIGNSVYLFLIAREGELTPLVRALKISRFLQKNQYLCLLYPSSKAAEYGKSLLDGFHCISIDELYQWLLERL